MPFLKYRCKECNKVFDQLVSTANMDTVRCEACGGETQRAYEGVCLFGNPASAAGRDSGCAGNCGGCSGCQTHAS